MSINEYVRDVAISGLRRRVRERVPMNDLLIYLFNENCYISSLEACEDTVEEYGKENAQNKILEYAKDEYNELDLDGIDLDCERELTNTLVVVLANELLREIDVYGFDEEYLTDEIARELLDRI